MLQIDICRSIEIVSLICQIVAVYSFHSQEVISVLGITNSNNLWFRQSLLIPQYNLDKRLPIRDNYLYSWHSLYCEMISRASFGIILSIGAVLLFAIWPNILLLQQHLATAQLIPGVVRVPTFGSSPADTTAAEAANNIAAVAPNITAGQAPANITAGQAQ